MMDHRRSTIFFFFVVISSAADPLKNLTASVGGNITLPDAVEEDGFLLYQGKNLALVRDKKLLEIFEEHFKQILNWDQNTGYFTLTGLQKTLSGIYALDSKKRRKFYVEYNLTVYDSVPTPQVSVLNRSSESCSLSCSVDSTQDDVTLLWMKDKNFVKRSHSAASLTVSYQQDQNVFLQCVAANPAEDKTLSGDVLTFCNVSRNRNTNSSTSSRHHWITITIITITTPIICALLVLLSAYIIKRFRHQKKLTVGQTEACV